MDISVYLGDDEQSVKLRKIVWRILKESELRGRYLTMSDYLRKKIGAEAEKTSSFSPSLWHGVKVTSHVVTLEDEQVILRIYEAEGKRVGFLISRFGLKSIPTISVDGKILKRTEEAEAFLEDLVEASKRGKLDRRREKIASSSILREVLEERIRRIEELYRDGKISEDKYFSMRDVLRKLLEEV